MPPSERPLLAREHSDTPSRGAEEEDALLTGQPTYKSEKRVQKWREIAAWTWAVVSTIVVIALAVAFSKEKSLAQRRDEGNCGSDKKPEGKRNLVFMVSDGMGPASLEMTRTFRQYTEKLEWNDTLTLDKHLLGQHRTRSSNSWVTDSAAGATAFSCGFKSFNGAIAVLPDHSPCGTVLEAAKKAGYMTGLVVTTLITDATPACFASHAQSRYYQDLIAEQLVGYSPLGRTVDLIMGGGRCHFLPNTTAGSCREDGKDIVAMARKDGWNYIDNKEDFDNLNGAGGIQLPLLALMADGNIPFEIDRRHNESQYPSQYDMAVVALDALKAATENSARGFFLMIEGSRIDNAGHFNDPAAQVHEVIIHDKTFKAVLDFLERDETGGVVLSTSDHETGGLSAARQLGAAYPQYRWLPSALAKANYSAEYLDAKWRAYLSSPQGSNASHAEQVAFLADLLPLIGVTDAKKDEIDALINNGDGTQTGGTQPIYLFSDMISRRAEIGWATEGHSAVDVNIYGSAPKYMSQVMGNRENTDIGKFLIDYLNVDVDAVTHELKKKNVKTSPAGLALPADDWEYAWTGPKVLEHTPGIGIVDHLHHL